jgi:uncharacterized MAPEG superfamily protein
MPQLPVSNQTLLLYAIAIASALIYLPLVVAAPERFKLGMDALKAPRAFTEKLPPHAQRAVWAHQNGFEAFSTFAAAALMAYVTNVQSPMAGWAAIAFVAARTLYPVFYINNILPGRSLMFGVGALSTLTLLVLSLTQH